MISWIIIILVVLVLLFILKFKELRHKLGFFVVILFFIFVAASFWNITSSNDINLNSFDGIVLAGKLYFAWLGNLFSTLGKVGGYVIHQDWGINSSNILNLTK